MKLCNCGTNILLHLNSPCDQICMMPLHDVVIEQRRTGSSQYDIASLLHRAG